MKSVWIQVIAYLFILVVLAIPLGRYIHKVMDGQSVFMSRFLKPIENGIYRFLNLNEKEEMKWQKYALCTLVFSILSFLVVFIIQLIQGILPLNPEGLGAVRPDLAFNTAVSFITNTNWQSYSGESTLSYFTQMIGLGVQNFVSAAVGIVVLYALIRGFTKTKQHGLGNFFKDMTRIVLYVLLPLSLVCSVALVSQGVTQSFKSYQTVDLIEPIIQEDGTMVKQAVVPLGPAASQIAIKQLGTNGGGFYGTNSAHPLENPNSVSNLIEMLSILLIPTALCFSFGHGIKDKRQGRALFIAMFMVLTVALSSIVIFEQYSPTMLSQNTSVDVSTHLQAGGNMEGKESRFGIATSSTWAAFTTAASNGSVNAMHDSFTPLGGMVPMLLMQLGEVIFGGVGCGLYGMIGFVILTVFIAGLMVGRTPEYLGKKIEPYEMKMAVMLCLATPVAILVGSTIATLPPSIVSNVSSTGAHGFSQILYAFTSAGGNNGSAFAGFNANTPLVNIILGFSMLFARFVPMIATLAMAGNLVQKKKVATSSGTLATHNTMFIGLLIFVILLVGALSFFPALALGPIAEFLKM